MKIFSILVLYKQPNEGSKARILKSSSDLSNFGYFQRGSVEEFLKFTSKILVERSTVGARSSVKEQDYIAHVYVKPDQLSCVIYTDQEYPKRVAHTLINKILEDFSKTVPINSWPTLIEE
jgi:synaptobrevin family protein YKT6